MRKAYKNLTIIKVPRTRLILEAASNKLNQNGFLNILADEGSSEQSVKVASKKLKGRWYLRKSFWLVVNIYKYTWFRLRLFRADVLNMSRSFVQV